MDYESAFNEGASWVRKCTCGRRFYQPNSYTNHINGCMAYKGSVGSSLESARARYKEKKSSAKKGRAALSSWFGEGNFEVDTVPTRVAPSQSQRLQEEPAGHLTPVSIPLVSLCLPGLIDVIGVERGPGQHAYPGHRHEHPE